MHCEYTRVFLRHCQGNDTSSVLSACVRVIDCYWKPSSFTLSQVWTADTQQVELMQTGPCWLFVKVSWKPLVWGDGKGVNAMYMDCLCMCLCCTLICITPCICGQSVASCSTNCSLCQRLCHLHLNHHCVSNKTTLPCPDILSRASSTIFW